MDLLLPKNDAESKLLRIAQCQSSAPVGSFVGSCGINFERSSSIRLYSNWCAPPTFGCLLLIVPLEDEMDVAVKNLGAIAAYYNISCLFLSYSWPFFQF